MIPFIDLKTQYEQLKPAIQKRMNAVLDHGQYIMGPEVREMEERLQAYSGAKHCISAASGTEALLMSMMALGIGPGDEVITTPFTYIATVDTIVRLGAVPVYADIEAGTCNIDVSKIEALINDRTKAMIPVSLYGQPADMDEMNDIAARHGNIAVIEDAAQSFGACYKGRKSGCLSRIGCTSFFPSKPLGCYGDGGAIFTNDDDIAQACREIRLHGQRERYVHHRIGVGGRMDTLQCAVVLAKLETFEADIAARIAIGKRYCELLEQMKAPLTLLKQHADRDCIWAQFTVFSEDRDALREKLAAQGIPTAVHYPKPVTEQPAFFMQDARSQLPSAYRAAERVLSLPMHPFLDEQSLTQICEAVAA